MEMLNMEMLNMEMLNIKMLNNGPNMEMLNNGPACLDLIILKSIIISMGVGYGDAG